MELDPTLSNNAPGVEGGPLRPDRSDMWTDPAGVLYTGGEDQLVTQYSQAEADLAQYRNTRGPKPVAGRTTEMFDRSAFLAALVEAKGNIGGIDLESLQYRLSGETYLGLLDLIDEMASEELGTIVDGDVVDPGIAQDVAKIALDDEAAGVGV